jgi:hypothetical protein
MIHDTTEANALLSGLQTNYYLTVNIDNDVMISPVIYHGCSCGFSDKCVNPTFIYDYPNSTSLFDVPDFYVGCYMIEAVLQSSLKCFYNQSCINKLKFYISSSVSMTVVALNESVPSLYSVNSTIKELVNDLMIEGWNGSTMYETYYSECQPTLCSYIVEARNNIVHIITTLFGIAGGLSTALNFIVPWFVKLIRKKREQSRRSNTGKRKSK